MLLPLAYLGLIFGTSYISEKAGANLKIAIIDSSGSFTQQRIDKANKDYPGSTLTLVKDAPADLGKDFDTKGYDGYVVIPANTMVSNAPDNLIIKSKKTLGTVAEVQAKLNTIWNGIKYERLGIDTLKQNVLNESKLNVKAENTVNKTTDASLAYGIGFACGLLIYFIVLLYGTQVMMGVMEEKTNRIAEIMVSSVKPFQMMIGKIIGIALVALTQFVLWILFITLIYNVSKAGMGDKNAVAGVIGDIQKIFTSVDVPLILSFCLYFWEAFLLRIHLCRGGQYGK